MSAVPIFSMAERDHRWDLAREFMTRADLDALLVFGEHEDAGPAPFAHDTWFTNGRAGTTVVFPRDSDPVSLFPMEMFTKDHLEPNYAFGRHLAYIGGTVIVGADEPIELNPYTAQILQAAGKRAIRRR